MCTHENQCAHLSLQTESKEQTPLEIVQKLVQNYKPKLPLYKYIDGKISLVKCFGCTNQEPHYVTMEYMSKSIRLTRSHTSYCQNCTRFRSRVSYRKVKEPRFIYSNDSKDYPVSVRCCGIPHGFKEPHYVAPELMITEQPKKHHIGSQCLACNNRAKYVGIGPFMRIRDDCKSSTTSRNSRKRKRNNYSMDLGDDDLKFLLELFVQQKGLCAYSGITLYLTKGHPHSMSIERIDTNLGYIKENVCFITRMLNTTAQWSKEYISILRKFVDTKSRTLCDSCGNLSYTHDKCDNCYDKNKECATESNTCDFCGIGIIRKGDRVCTVCRRKYSTTFYGLPSRLYTNTRGSASRRKLEFTLTQTDIKTLVENSPNCYYSKIGFIYGTGRDGKYGVFSPSIERVNPDLGYTLNNVVLILAGFNNSDLTKRSGKLSSSNPYRTTWCKESCEHLISMSNYETSPI